MTLVASRPRRVPASSFLSKSLQKENDLLVWTDVWTAVNIGPSFGPREKTHSANHDGPVSCTIERGPRIFLRCHMLHLSCLSGSVRAVYNPSRQV